MDKMQRNYKKNVNGRIDLEKLMADINAESLSEDKKIDADDILKESTDTDLYFLSESEAENRDCIIANLSEYDDSVIEDITSIPPSAMLSLTDSVTNIKVGKIKAYDGNKKDEEIHSIRYLKENGIMNTLHARASLRVKASCAKIYLPFAVVAFISFIAEIITLLLLFPITGMCYTMLDNSVYEIRNREKTCFKSFFFVNNIGAAVKTTVVYRLMILAGLVCFIIPAIFVYCNYSMYAMIISDTNSNDSKNVSDILIQSRDFMSGHKLQYLRLTLYMFFPILLTVLSLGLLSIWTVPYITALKVEFYSAIKYNEIPNFRLKKQVKPNKNFSK